MASCFKDRQRRSMKMLSRYQPRPPIETRTSTSVSVMIHADPVNCDPWSVFMISGVPCLAIASFQASTQKSACIVFDNRQFSTLRVAQSIIATSYKNPFLTGTKVMSAHQTWFGRSITIFLSRYG